MKNILRSMKLWQKFATLGVIGAVMTAVPAATDVTTAPVPEPATVATARLSLDH